MPGYHTLTADRPSAAARQWDWRDFYRNDTPASVQAGGAAFAPGFTIAQGLGGQSPAWDLDYARQRLDQVADLHRFRARFWQMALPALGLFWATVIWAFVV